MAHIPKECAALLTNPFNLSFLVGSGVSADAGLPTGWAFNKGLAKYLGVTRLAKSAAASLFITGPSSNVENCIRFEHALQILRDVIDPHLDILQAFETNLVPDGLHEFLAKMLADGSTVLTTNFDSLIEAAYFSNPSRSSIGLRQVALDSASYGRSTECPISFATYLVNEERKPAILKLHGTLRGLDFILHGQRTRTYTKSLGATLDTVVTRRGPNQLSRSKNAAFVKSLAGRTLVVIGYSALDDFDIVPVLLKNIPLLQGLIFISHEEKQRILWRRVKSKRDVMLLPASLRNASYARVPIWVARGKATNLVSLIHGSKVDASSVICPPVEYLLGSIDPYQSMTRPIRLRILGQMLHEAQRLSTSRRIYQQCLKLLDSENDITLEVACHLRLGQIAREQARYEDAIAHYKIVTTKNKHYDGAERDQATAINGIGTVYMFQGKHRQAARMLKAALKIFSKCGNLKHQGRVTTNLAIIARREGRFSKALELSRRAARFARAARDPHGLAQDLGNEGGALLGLQKYREARKAFDQSICLAKKLGAIGTLATSTNNAALASKHLGNLKHATSLLKQALALNQTMGRKDAVIDNLGNIAEILELRGLYAQSEKYILMALKDAEKIGDSEGIAIQLENLSRVLRQRGETAKSERTLHRAVTLFKHLGNKTKVSELMKEFRKAGEKLA